VITVCIGDVGYAEDSRPEELPPGEQARLGRLLRPADRRLFLATWTAATRLLAARLQVAPRKVELDRRCARCGDATHGRPVLRQSTLRLSVSHSGEQFAVAIADELDVGVDVEQETAELWSPAMHEVVLAPDEPVPSRASQAVVWTRKEAVLKCVGVGLLAQGAGVVAEVVAAQHRHPEIVEQHPLQ